MVAPNHQGHDQANASGLAYILQVQDPGKRAGCDESWLKVTLPQTYAYLKQFEVILRQRSGFRKYFCTEMKDPETGKRQLVSKAPFYSLYNVGPYTLAPFKVVWREQAAFLTTAVIGSVEGKPIIPDHKLMLVPLDDEEEAHYICALLGSSIAQFVVKSYVVEVPTSTHVLENIKIPKYDPANPLHQELAELSQRAHELAARDEKEKLREVEEEVDEKAAQLWGLTGEELRGIKRSLEELR